MTGLGIPYDIMYQSKGVSNLQGIVAFVRKPGGAVVGPFQFVEGTGAFLTCYFSTFYTTLADPSGRYFVRVFSPTEQISTVTAFYLSPDAPVSAGGGSGGRSDRPLLGVVGGRNMQGLVLPDSDPLMALLPNDFIQGSIDPEPGLMGAVDDSGLQGEAGASNLNLDFEGD